MLVNVKLLRRGPHLGLVSQSCRGEEAVRRELLCLYPISWFLQDPAVSRPLCSLRPSPLSRTRHRSLLCFSP